MQELLEGVSLWHVTLEESVMRSLLCSKGTETLKAEKEMDVLVTQSGEKSHPLNYISAQEKTRK